MAEAASAATPRTLLIALERVAAEVLPKLGGLSTASAGCAELVAGVGAFTA